MPKKNKPQSMYRTAWSSIKNQVAPEALKLCNFGSGLGPDLDKIAKKLDGLYDLDAVPPKEIQAVVRDVAAIQATMTKYFNQVIAANRKHPQHGPAWLNLHEALRHVDKLLVAEAKEFGAAVSALTHWKGKDEFAARELPEPAGGRTDRPARDRHVVVEGEESDPFEKLIRKLDALKDDPAKILSLVADKKLNALFPHNPRLSAKIIEQSLTIKENVRQINSKLGVKPTPDLDGARRKVREIGECLTQLERDVGEAGALLPEFLRTYIHQVMAERIDEAAE
jgi:hypothetical protein